MKLVYIILFIILILVIIVIWNYKVSKNENWSLVSKNQWLANKEKYVRKEKYKCCVVSGDNRQNQEIEMLKEINQKYCNKNEYDFIFLGKSGLDKYDKNYPPYWWKVKVVYDIMLKSKYDYVMWVDSDACFHDHNVRIESIWQKDKIFIMAKDNEISKVFKDFIGEFNAGVWIVKNNFRGRSFMKDWLNLYEKGGWYKRDDEWICRYYFLPCMWAGKYYEQGSCYELMHKSEYAPYILQLHCDILQGCKTPNKFSYTLHFCGDNKKYIKKYYNRFY